MGKKTVAKVGDKASGSQKRGPAAAGTSSGGKRDGTASDGVSAGRKGDAGASVGGKGVGKAADRKKAVENVTEAAENAGFEGKNGTGTVYVLEAGAKIYVKTAALCAMLGKSNQWIGQLTAQGTICKSKTPHGMLYELGTSVRAYCRVLEVRSEKEEDKSSMAEIERDIKRHERTYKKGKAIISMAEANELQGKMHRSEDVLAMTEDLVYAIRGGLMALPGRLAVDVANAGDAATAEQIIRREVALVMEELSNYRYDPEKYRERVRKRRDWETNADGDGEEGGQE